MADKDPSRRRTWLSIGRTPAARNRLWTRLWWVFWLGGIVFLFSGSVIQLGAFEFNTISLDWEFIQQWALFISEGVFLTIQLALFSIVIALILAFLSALARLSHIPPLVSLAGLYISLFRGTPLFLQFIFIYLALPQVGLVLDSFTSAVVALSLNYGAYLSEIFRAGIQAVNRGQVEAATALGLTPWQTMRRIVLPQAVRIITPDIGNQFIMMQKDTSLASAIAVTELMGKARQAGAPRSRLFEALVVAACWYWLMTIVFTFFQEMLERRMARSDR